MNYYRTLNKPGGYKKPHRKNEELVLEITQHGGGKAKGQNTNPTRMVNHIVSNVKVNIIG